MSIASEIIRLQGVKADILTAIADKGVTVPAGSALDECPGLISDIGNTDVSKFSFAYNGAYIVNGKTVLSGGTRHFVAGTNSFNFPSRLKIQIDFIIDSISSNPSYLIMAGYTSASGLAIYFDNQKIAIWETTGTDPEIDYNVSLVTNKNYRVVLECINSKKYKFYLIDKDTQTTIIDSICDYTIDISWNYFLTFGGMRYGNSSSGFELHGSIDLKNTKVIDLDTNVMVWGLDTSSNSAIIGGKRYKTVIMPDGKEWLAENLDFKFCNIGGSGTPSTANAWYYNNDESTYGWNGYKCGLLYNWYAVKVLYDNRSELIPGWHVPTSTELDDLATAIGGASTAGTKLKALDDSAGTGFPSGWNGTDDYGFSLLPAGGYTGSFLDVGTYGILWSITENSTTAYGINCGVSSNFSNFEDPKNRAYSLRLVRDT